MSIEAFALRLGDLEIFRGLTPDQRIAIARTADRVIFRQGQEIIRKGNAGDCAYLIVSGDAVTLADPDVGLAEQPVSEGSLIGEMAMMIEHEYAATVIARGTVRCLRLPRESMHRLMSEDPSISEQLISRIVSRLTRIAVELRRVDQMLALASEAAPTSPA